MKDLALAGECHLLKFDLESVRYCPAIEAKTIFYKRRLAIYNLTVYNAATKKNPQTICGMKVWLREGQLK